MVPRREMHGERCLALGEMQEQDVIKKPPTSRERGEFRSGPQPPVPLRPLSGTAATRVQHRKPAHKRNALAVVARLASGNPHFRVNRRDRSLACFCRSEEGHFVL